jgi:phospholipase C
VEAGKTLSGRWNAGLSYDLSVYGSNGFTRYFKAPSAQGANRVIAACYERHSCDSIGLAIANASGGAVMVQVLEAYTGKQLTVPLRHGAGFEDVRQLDSQFGWYDLVVTVSQDPTFRYRFAGYVESERDSFSEPALGGLVTLPA